MELLLIGMSRFAQRRVLPAAAAMDEIDKINIASSHARPETIEQVPKLGRVYTDWRAALDASPRGLAYVSLVNSQHAPAVRHAIKRGHHVVVDKPGLLNLETAEEVVDAARSSALVVAEATCYSFHPMFDSIRSVLSEHDADIRKAVAVFTPPVPVSDFRHRRELGGGAILDTGPYMASLGRVLWDAEPERLEVIVADRTADSLETSYSVLAGYPDGRTIVGHFGFTTVYRNSLLLTGKSLLIEVDRPFSAPPDMAVELRLSFNYDHDTHAVEPADSMQIFLSEVINAAKEGVRKFDAPLLSDARTLDRLIQAASSC